MKHKINVVFEYKHPANLGAGFHIRKSIRKALEHQKMNQPAEINVLVTDNQGIRKINLASREIDRETDVLSFPMFSFVPGELPQDWNPYIDLNTGRVVLGDMVLSMEKALEQGVEFGHGVKREIGYLTVHSVLHLLGYDHLDEGEMKKQMRRQEEEIMSLLMLER